MTDTPETPETLTAPAAAPPEGWRRLWRWRTPRYRPGGGSAEGDIWMAGVGSMLVLTLLVGYGLYATQRIAIADWSDRMDGLSTALAEHASQTLGSGHTALNALSATVEAQHLKDQAAYQAWARAPEQYRILLAAKQANPFIDVATFVAGNGEVLSFSRSYPAPQISLADRSYFKAHVANAQLGVVTSEPVANKGNGRWLFYLSRRINDAQGQMLGLVLVGISVDTFSQVYEKVGSNLGEGAVISLFRDDFLLMARWPAAPGMLGTTNRQGATHKVLGQPDKTSGVIYTDAISPNQPQGTPRLAAPRRVPGFPFIVTPLVTQDRYLQRWQASARWALLLWLGVMALLMTGMHFLLKTARRARRMGSERSAAEQALAHAADELESRVDGRTATLREEIAARVAREREVAALNAKLVTLSHQAGMAEVATSVLHNVGNVLNSLNTSSSVIAQKLKQTPLEDLPRAADLVQGVLQDPGTTVAQPAQAQQLANFLQLLASHWREEQAVLLRESGLLRRQVDHIRDIIARQQSLSGHSGLIEHFHPAEVLTEVAQMHDGALQRSRVSLCWGEMSPQRWLGDRGKFMQICLNLITNAEQALAASAQTDRRMNLSCQLEEGGQLRVQVADNGAGISAQALSRLFTYGFTTKASGHGLGLHASALAAQSMGGALDAFSSGPGLGATFTLSLPHTEEMSQEA